jgi:hypothetical protein
VVFSIDGTLAAAVTGVKLQDSDDNSTFADLLAGPNIPSGSGAGTRIVVPFPLDHKRYVRASATAGTAGVNVAAWFEPGPNH